MGTFCSAIEGAPEETSESVPNTALQDLYKHAQDVAFEVELKDALDLHLKLNLLVHLLV